VPIAVNTGKFVAARLLFPLWSLVAVAQNRPLTFVPLDAGYSNALDRIIMVSASPNQLHAFNAATGADIIVPLSAPPLSLSVSPDGRCRAQ
jgi:hypothetical protein